MFWKVRYQRRGGHIHCALFCAPGRDRTYAKCGDFVVRDEEFISLREAFRGAWFEEAT